VDAKQRYGFSRAGDVTRFCCVDTIRALKFRATDLQRWPAKKVQWNMMFEERQ
jgi:hypothetical protein